MKVSGVVQGAVLLLTLMLTLTDSQNSRKGRKCRCQKYFAEVNRAIDTKLKAFEDKFSKYLNPLSGNISSESQKLAHINSKMAHLDVNMNETKENLRRESYNLRKLQEHMYSQELTLDSLNDNFLALDNIVRNLSSVVEKLEHIVNSRSLGLSQSGNSLPQMDTDTTSLPGFTRPKTYAKDCDEVYKSGTMKYLGDYYIFLKPTQASEPFKVYCKVINNAGWTLIQRRLDGSVDFYKYWEDYKRGFGNLEGEFWLGNENLHQLTSKGPTKLRIEMEQWNGKRYYAEYERFSIGSEEEQYGLRVSGYHGTAGDSLTPYWKSHDAKPFSTRDRDNDDRIYDNCADHYRGAWWFNNCFESHLNGQYYKNGSHNNYFIRDGIQWNSIHSYSSLRYVEMMVRPADDVKISNEV